MNSTVNLTQLFIERVPTGWFKVRGYTFANLKILSPRRLTKKEKALLENVFESISRQPFPCIWKQLAMNCDPKLLNPDWTQKLSEILIGFENWIGRTFEPRRKIDQAVLRVLGFDSKSIQKILKWLYPALLKEIYILKKMNRVDTGS